MNFSYGGVGRIRPPPSEFSGSAPDSLKIKAQYNVEKFLPGIPGVFDTLCLGGGEFDNVTQNLGGEFSTVWDRWV